jgi:hypothetical protein
VAGAFGDLGLYLPIVVALASAGAFELSSAFVASGLLDVASGVAFRQPIPVQPMKAVAAIALAEHLRPSAIVAAGLALGGLVLVLGATGLVDRLRPLVPVPLVRGIQLAVGAQLVLHALARVRALPFVAIDGVLVAAVVLAALAWSAARQVPLLPAIFLSGLALAPVAHPDLATSASPAAPALAAGLPDAAAWRDGIVRLALPQLPLTLLNSVFAACDLSERYYPGRGVAPRTMARVVGLMNLATIPFGGVPSCHGSSGLAAQRAFGARTGLAPALLGVGLVVTGVAIGPDGAGILRAYPQAILAPMLVVAAGSLLRAGANVHGRTGWTVALGTAASMLVIGGASAVAIGVGLALAARLVEAKLGRPDARHA